MNQYEKAVSAYREALRLKPDDPRATEEIGIAYLYLNQYPNAAGALQRAIRLEPGNVDAQWFLGITDLKMGKKEDALQVYRALQKLDATTLAPELYEKIRMMK